MRTRAEANRQRWAILGFAVAVLLLSLVLSSAYYELVLTQVLLWAVLSLAWNILSGYSGYFSFGHAAFWGLGAYTVVLGMVDFDLTPWLTIPFCAVVGAAAGALIGYPTFRLRGHYFALAMLAYPLATLYVFAWLGYQEVTLPMKRESAGPLHAVRRPADLCRAGARPRGGIAVDLAQGREFADGHGAPGDQAERAGGRGGGDRHLALEDAGPDAVGRARRGGRRVLRGRAPGGDAGDRVRHAGVGPGPDPRLVRRGREPVGAGHRRDGAGAARRRAERRTRQRAAGHPGRRLRHRDHRHHPARARGRLLARARLALTA